MKQWFLTISCLLLSLPVFSQNASGISGLVMDSDNQPAIAALVVMKSGGPNGPIAGRAVTDADGAYLIKPLTPGSYTLVASYLSDTQTINAIRILSSQVITKNIMLGQAGVIEEVYVTGIRYAGDPLIDQGSKNDVPAKKAKGKPDYSKADGIATDRNVQPWGKQKTLKANGNRANTNRYYNPSTEAYKKETENDFRSVRTTPLSTLSVDVDRASYSNIRRYISAGQKPPADAVRVEEMINYFDYQYPQPTGDDPIAIVTELADCPWNENHKVLHIGMQARKISTENLPASNLVFLVDVSGSMSEANKLPLVISSLQLLVNNLREKDRVAIVVYAGAAGIVLPSTPGSNKTAILEALEKLQAGGSTAGGAGILLAYKTAMDNFIKGGNNRVILATDGDFNVGVSNNNELEELIVKQREQGVFLSVLGYGMGNYKDDKMQMLADKGNGNHAYIDNIMEAQKVLVTEFGGTLFTVAKDVKAQVEFNPGMVQAYRLIGYENRLLNTEDFKDDKKDAGEMGSGHTVTMLYEIIPAGVESKFAPPADSLKYQKNIAVSSSRELATVKFRYKQPDGKKSKEMVHPISAETRTLASASENMRFSASVALFGMMLSESKYRSQGDYKTVLSLAEAARGADKEGYRAEFIRLVKAVK